MWKGLGVGVGAILILVGATTHSGADPLRVPKLSEAALRAAMRVVEESPRRVTGATGRVALGLRGGLAALAAPGPAPRATKAWMPASSLPLSKGTDKPMMEKAAGSLNKIRRRVMTAMFGKFGERMGFYAGGNLAKGDISGVKCAGIKIEF